MAKWLNLPKIARKQAVLGSWLLSAYRAPIATVVLTVAMSAVVLPAVDRQLQKRYKPISVKAIFGLMEDFHNEAQSLKDR